MAYLFSSSEDSWTPPRRIRLDLFTPAEKAIHDAMQAVEHAGCDVRLTDAVILLSQARERVADFVDGVAPESRLHGAGWLSPEDVRRVREALRNIRSYLGAAGQDIQHEWLEERLRAALALLEGKSP